MELVVNEDAVVSSLFDAATEAVVDEERADLVLLVLVALGGFDEENRVDLFVVSLKQPLKATDGSNRSPSGGWNDNVPFGEVTPWRRSKEDSGR